VYQNSAGKPRKGAFEVLIRSKTQSKQLFSKLDKYGTKKGREFLPDPLELVAGPMADFVQALDESELQGVPEEAKYEQKISHGDYDRMTVAQLRNELRSAKLSTTGKKAELLDRLKSSKAA